MIAALCLVKRDIWGVVDRNFVYSCEPNAGYMYISMQCNN